MFAGLEGISVSATAPLARYTRFAIGGPARLLANAADPETFMEAVRRLRAAGVPFAVIGGGTNLIVSDDGFPGVVLRFTGDRVEGSGTSIRAAAGAALQSVVDFSIERGLAGLHTMTGIPGWVGAAVYGNAGAYGNSIGAFVRRVDFSDGHGMRSSDRAGCEFRYRDSVFKRRKDSIIFAVELELPEGNPPELARRAAEILATRNAKYPPDMKCAGSIFKNLILAELPPRVQRLVPPEVIREGKVPSAWFLEQAGAKGLSLGDIRVADYHANLIYNSGAGTAREVCALIGDLAQRVRGRFGFDLEEEVQYLGFESPVPPASVA